MAFSDLVGNHRVADALVRAIAADRLPHALLFAGPRGVGKMTFARELARAVTCHAPRDGNSCGICVSCIQATADEHPDIRTYQPDGAFIKIAQIRDLNREAQFQPFDGRRRVMLIDAAHQLREEAGNALLKTLEEPPPTSLLVLVTDRPYTLLPTILSRCQTLWFSPIDPEELERYLAANFKRSADDTRLLARISGGRIGKALATDLSEYLDQRKEILGLVELLAAGEDRIRLLKAAQYLADVGRKDRAEFEARLELFTDVCRDVYALALGGSPDAIANIDITLRLQQIAEGVAPERIAGWVEAIVLLREQLKQNVSRQLALEAIFLSQERLVVAPL